MPARISLVISRRAVRRFVWTGSVLLAGGLGWGMARFGLPGVSPRPAPETAVVAHAALEPDGNDLVETRRQPRDRSAPDPVTEPHGERQPDPAPPPEPGRAPALEAPTSLHESEHDGPASPPQPGRDVLGRAERTDRLAERGEVDGARLEAEGLVAEFPSYSELTAAFVDGGASQIRARLSALRVLQVAGHDSISQELARELKRSHASTPEVSESIRQWGILTPRITSVGSLIDNGDHVVVTGTLENPDIGDVRRVRILVEALDVAGGLLATAEVRVQPKVLTPGSRGDFTARFKKLDPTTVLRARATIVEWESEVLNAG